MLFFRFLLVCLLLGLFVMFGQALQPQQQATQPQPSYELQVGAKHTTIRNIGSFQVDSALIFPKREAKDTLNKNNKTLRRKGAFFYDSMTHIVWFFDGTYFRRADSSIYNSDGVIETVRQVDIRGKDKAYLYFKNGSVHIDTLLIRNKKLGTSFDSLLVVRKDSVYRISRDSVFNIYNKSDSIREDRVVTIKAGNNKPNVTPSLKFKDGRVEIDTLLVRKRRLGLSTDTFLVVHKDTVRYIPKDSLWNIYNKSDSIRNAREVVLHVTNGNKKIYNRLYFKDGSVHVDTLLIKKLKQGSSSDSVLVVKNDSIRRISVDSLKNIYTKSDSIIADREVVLHKKPKGAAKYYHLHFKEGAVWIDTLLLKNKKLGTSFDSLLVVRKDSVYRISRDSVFNIYNKSDSIREERIVTIKAGNNKPNVTSSLKFKDGRVEIDTLLVRKRRLGLSTDTFLVVHKDTVRYIPKDSLWNIYTGDDSLRKTGTDGKRTVYLNAKKLVFELGNKTTNGTTNTNGADSGKIGIGQKEPVYTLDIATKTALKEPSNNGAAVTSTTNDYDSVAVRISHNVTENGNGDEGTKARTRYGLLISEHSYKAFGRSALGFYSDHNSANFIKARLWTQVGNGATAPKFGIDVADKDKQIQTRMIIDSAGGVAIDTLKTGNSKLRIVGHGVSFSDGIVNISNPHHNNYLRLQAGWTDSNYSGIWLTEHNNNFGWRLVNNTNSDKFQLVTTRTNSNTTNTSSDNPFKDTVFEIKRTGVTVLNVDVGSAQPGTNNNPDSIALLIKHNVWEPNYAYTFANPGYTYGLMLFDSSNKAFGRSAIGFLDGGNNVGTLTASSSSSTTSNNGSFLPFVKARMWTQLGINAMSPKFGIDVADKDKRIQTRFIIDSAGGVGIDTLKTGNSKLRIAGKGVSFNDGIVNISNPNHDNYLRLQAGGTASNYSGIWLTEHNNTFGWRMVNNAKSDKFQLVTTDSNTPTKDTVLEIKRTGVTVLNVDVGSAAPSTASGNNSNPDSIALLIKHNVWETSGNGGYGYTYGLMLFDSSNKAKGRAAIGFYNGGYKVGTLNNAVATSSTGTGGVAATPANGAFPAFVKARMWSEVGSGAKHPEFGIDVADSNRRIQTRLTIDDSGLVKIGLTNEAKVKLEINGRLKINNIEEGTCGDSFLVIKNSVVKKICFKNANCTTPCATTAVTSNIGNSNGANFLVSSGVQPISDFYSSDSILKRGIVSLDGSLDRVLQLRPVTYYWKDSSSFNGFSSDRQFGFIAQEVRGVFPDLVRFGNFGSSSHLTLNYIGLISPLVGAVQELYHTQKHDRQDYNKLQSQVMELQSQLRSEKEFRNKLERRIEILEKLLINKSKKNNK